MICRMPRAGRVLRQSEPFPPTFPSPVLKLSTSQVAISGGTELTCTRQMENKKIANRPARQSLRHSIGIMQSRARAEIWPG